MKNLLQIILSCAIPVLGIAWYLGSGYLTWEWISPDGFIDFLLFLFVWNMVAVIGGGLGQLIFVGIISLFDKN